MMPAILVRTVHQLGGEITVDGTGGLHLTSPSPLPDDLLDDLRQNKAAVVRFLDCPPPMPPLPKSVRACLDFVERTHGKRELTAGLHGWLDKEWSRIERYERAMEADYDRKTAS